jgi:hypothetical protein
VVAVVAPSSAAWSSFWPGVGSAAPVLSSAGAGVFAVFFAALVARFLVAYFAGGAAA